MKWKWREIQRLYRKYIHQERSKRMLIDVIGPFWLLLHGAKVEHKVKLYKTGDGWYCIDLAIPHKKIALEAKGGSRKYYDGDILRDQGLKDAGWTVERITEAEMRQDPKGVRRRLRELIKG